MTIQTQGHVEKMETGHKDRIQLTIRAGNMPEPFVVLATKEELAGLYLPGTSVEITIRPIDRTHPKEK